MFSSGKPSSKAISEQLYQLARAPNREGFLKALREYENDPPLLLSENFASDIYQFYTTVVGAAASLGEMECRALWEKVGDEAFLKALNDRGPAAEGPGWFFSPLKIFCTSLSYDFIKEVFSHFNIKLDLPKGRKTWKEALEDIRKNNTLSTEQKNELCDFFNLINNVRLNPKRMAQLYPDNFMKVYFLQKRQFPPISVQPPETFKKYLATKKEAIQKNFTTKEKLKSIYARNEEKYEKNVSDRKKWVKENKPYFDGLTEIVNGLLTRRASDGKHLSAFSDLAMYYRVQDEQKEALVCWAKGLKAYWPSHFLKESIQESGFPLVDFLRHSPEKFEPFLSAGECKLIGIEMMLGESRDYHEIQGLSDLSEFKVNKDKDNTEIKKETKEEVKEETKEEKKVSDDLEDKDDLPLLDANPKIAPEVLEAELLDALRVLASECLSKATKLLSPHRQSLVKDLMKIHEMTCEVDADPFVVQHKVANAMVSVEEMLKNTAAKKDSLLASGLFQEIHSLLRQMERASKQMCDQREVQRLEQLAKNPVILSPLSLDVDLPPSVLSSPSSFFSGSTGSSSSSASPSVQAGASVGDQTTLPAFQELVRFVLNEIFVSSSRNMVHRSLPGLTYILNDRMNSKFLEELDPVLFKATCTEAGEGRFKYAFSSINNNDAGLRALVNFSSGGRLCADEERICRANIREELKRYCIQYRLTDRFPELGASEVEQKTTPGAAVKRVP